MKSTYSCNVCNIFFSFPGGLSQTTCLILKRKRKSRHKVAVQKKSWFAILFFVFMEKVTKESANGWKKIVAMPGAGQLILCVSSIKTFLSPVNRGWPMNVTSKYLLTYIPNENYVTLPGSEKISCSK